ncbi:MAG TPA: NADH-quinone oxidoreductase subunit C [Thermodesulfobacteriaceae bacterium]|nr:NADH-quinone oxidoreductase subunit C [Thermodesulfobacteriaceae bacterium]
MHEIIEKALKESRFKPVESDHQATGLHCHIHIEPVDMEGFVFCMRDHGFFLELITAIDLIEENEIEGLYVFNHYQGPARIAARIKTARDNPVLPSIGSIYPGAVWHERETAEFFGITFEGSMDTRHLLLPEDFAFHPLRKNFKAI